MSLKLPQSTVKLIGSVEDQRHPGLQLDKFSVPGDQQAQKTALDTVCRISGDPALLAALVKRRTHAFETLPGASAFRGTTTGPLTLHLSRASALENAGICLHPLYGFAYLPGSGLKGMARAYAETVWLPAQTEQKPAWRQIEDVFGWAPNPDRRQQITDRNHPAEPRRPTDADPDAPEINAHVGNIVFYDAWPDAWPRLFVDIVNNHHPAYYQPLSDDSDDPPGDWENPVPVYFLAVKPGSTFTFPLAKRRADVADDLLTRAHEWLSGALCHLGAGAKTNAGYGAFKPADRTQPTTTARLLQSVTDTWQAACNDHGPRKEFTCTLELVTPAFLAGAEPYGDAAKDGCDLRPATLRGHLRWWWRTMHAGFVDVKTLRALEAAIWGDTRSGGAVRIIVEKLQTSAPHLYDKRSKADFNDQQKRSEHGIPNADARKTTQGLWYSSYGMDEGGYRNRRPRHVLEPPAAWRVRLIARATRFSADRKDTGDPRKAAAGRPVTARQVLEQARGALGLLCHYGGIGSKAGKGFGSLAASEFDEWNTDQCRKPAARLRQHLQLSNAFNDSLAESSSLQQMLDPVEVTFSWPNVWDVLDQIGFAYQAFAKKHKHQREKMALGLPRRIGKPARGTFHPAQPVTTNSRHASPVHIHVEPRDGAWAVRAVAFPAAHLPDLGTSQTFLKEFLTHFGGDIQRRANLQPPSSGRRQAVRAPREQVPSSSRGPTGPQPGETVDAVLLEEKTRKGGWKAKHLPTGIAGPIQNSPDVPDDKKTGDRLTLIVASVNPREIAFRYPTPSDKQRAQKAQGKPKPGRRGGQPRERR